MTTTIYFIACLKRLVVFHVSIVRIFSLVEVKNPVVKDVFCCSVILLVTCWGNGNYLFNESTFTTNWAKAIKTSEISANTTKLIISPQDSTSCKVVVYYSSTHHKALKPTQSTILYDIDLLSLSTHCDTRKGVELDKPNHPNIFSSNIISCTQP